MTTKEFIELGNKLSALEVDLMNNNKNADLWIAFRNVRNRGHLMDISLFFYNDNTTIEYRYKFARGFIKQTYGLFCIYQHYITKLFLSLF